MPGPTLWSTALRACLAGFAAVGLDSERVCRDAGIEPAALADPDARIPFASSARVWPAAQAQWRKPGLGLATGLALPFGELGVVDYALASAPNLTSGLEQLTRAFRVVSFGATRFEWLRPDRRDGELRFSGPFPPDVRDYAVAGMVGRLRRLGVRPAAITFVGPTFDVAPAYERGLGIIPRFGKTATAIRLRAEDLDRPRSDDRYRGLGPIVGREVERLLGDSSEQSASAEARRVIARRLPAEHPDVQSIARALGISARTLQRRLAEEGTNVRALIEQTRVQLALAHLASDRLTIAEVAYLLGYSESGTFTTAFKRWRGVSPSEYRRALVTTAP